jgi:hypothetical protein
VVQLRRGKKDSKTVAGAPFPPAVEHSDGPDHPRRDVPTVDADGDVPPDAGAETEEEEST